MRTRKFLISAGLAVGSVLFGASAAQAQDDCEASTAAAADCTTAVRGAGAPGSEDGTSASGETAVLGQTQVRGQQLPTTGADSAVIAGIGAASILAGGVLIARSRNGGTVDA